MLLPTSATASSCPYFYMSQVWHDQLESLQKIADIVKLLTDRDGGGADKKLPYYKELRSSRLQLRFAHDLITVIQFYLTKEKALLDADLCAEIRHGDLGVTATDLELRRAEELSRFASEKDLKELEGIVRKLSFGSACSSSKPE